MYRFHPKTQLKLPAVLTTLLAICVPLSATAALPAYMEVTGETQGIIEGSVTLTGREGQMEIIEFGHSISQALDSATGVPTGDKQHRAIRVTKPVDKASPLLMTALTTKEKLTNVTIRFWRPNDVGQEIQFYTVALLNAYITNIAQSNRVYDGDDWTTALNVPANETLTLSYQKIIWTWEDGGITSEDDWAQGNP